FISVHSCRHLSYPPSFPTPRSSDLKVVLLEEHPQVGVPSHCSGVVSLNGLTLLGIEPNSIFTQRIIQGAVFNPPKGEPVEIRTKDRKSIRLNSSHEWISYAVFCLKK